MNLEAHISLDVYDVTSVNYVRTTDTFEDSSTGTYGNLMPKQNFITGIIPI